MDARIIHNLERIDTSLETADLTERWRNTVKPGRLPTFKGQVEEVPQTKIPSQREKNTEKRLTEITRRVESPAGEVRNRPYQNEQQADYFPDWHFTEARNFEGGFIPRNQEENQPCTSRECPTTQ